MKLLKILPVMAVSTALSFGLASTAQADAYAVSFSNITDLTITTTPVFTILPGNDTSQATAALNGASDTDASAIDAAAINAPGSNPAVIRTNNTFNQFGQVSASYSNADAVIDSRQASGDAFTQVRAIGESYVAGDSSATTTQTENASDTGFIVTVTTGSTLSFEFNAYKYLQAALTADAVVPGSSARSTMNATITLTDVISGLTIFSWSPDGQAGGITNGIENTDTFSLNESLATNFPGTSPTQTWGGCTIAQANSAGTANACFGSFSATTNILAAGSYSLGLSIKNTTAVTSVPEPGSLALLGLGMLGLGVVSRRRKAA